MARLVPTKLSRVSSPHGAEMRSESRLTGRSLRCPFLVVSKAFQILSDGDKRAMFDRSGGDPDSRASMSSSGPTMRSYGGGGSPFGGGGFQGGEINPEDLFNAFFGGGGFGQGAQSAHLRQSCIAPLLASTDLALP
jgi:DnaJ-class molecular chaperone